LLTRETPYETAATARLDQLRTALASLPADQVAARIVQGQTALLSRATAEIVPLRAVADPVGPNLSDLPKELTDRFVGKNQTYLLKVFAHGNIWNMEQLEKFVHALEGVDPRITGHPVQTYYASRHMQSSYLWAGLYSLGAVLALLWIDFRSLKHSLLAMVPLAIGFATMCGCLGWLDIPFNPANMIVLPLILGIGVDHGVHLVHLWRQQRGRFVLGDATTVAVLLTASTTTASFGALILARHQGLQSLGQVLTLGVTTCLAASIVFFPALLCWLTRNRPAQEVETAQLPPVSQPIEPVTEFEQPIEPAPEIAQPETLLFAAEIEPIVPPAELTALEPAAIELPPLPPISPAPVTDEEIAALLESALSVLPGPVPASEEPVAGEPSEFPASIPRRRDLPRRSEAA
jgi:hypothetical protein